MGYWRGMRTDIAAKLQHDHEQIRAGLARATQEGGSMGDAARRLSDICLPHFELEERVVLPVLARLNQLADREEEREEIADLYERIGEMSRQHKRFAAEHRSVVSALDTLSTAAHKEGSRETLELTEMLRDHEAFEDHLDLEGYNIGRV
jgi:hypothetical protein